MKFQKRIHNEFKTTTNQTVYNRLLRKQFSCSFCPPNAGDNGNNKSSRWHRCWKTQRKTQYKMLD